MDYPLGVLKNMVLVSVQDVLIPILMDYPLGADKYAVIGADEMSLNPYSNGLPSRGRSKMA